MEGVNEKKSELFAVYTFVSLENWMTSDDIWAFYALEHYTLRSTELMFISRIVYLVAFLLACLSM